MTGEPTAPRNPRQPAVTLTPRAPALTVAQRRARLDQRIALLAENYSCTVQLRGDLHAIVELSGPPPVHIRHAALTIATAGWWLLIWLALARQQQPRRIRLRVDTIGVIRITHAPD